MSSSYEANIKRLQIGSTQGEIRGLSFNVPLKPNNPPAELDFLLRVYKAPDSGGWSTDAFGAEQVPILSLRLDITPMRLPQPLLGILR